jgi:hypothetical protein
MLSQLIRCDGNLVDLQGVSTKSCRVDFMINGNKEDDGKNDGSVDDPFDDNKELVAVSVEAGEPTEVVGEEGGAFLMEAKRKLRRQNINGLHVAMTSNVKREQKGNRTLDTVSRLHELLKKIQNGL